MEKVGFKDRLILELGLEGGGGDVRGMARNEFLARRLSKMKSRDLYKPSFPALLLSTMFINEFQGGPKPPQCFLGAP